MQTPDSGPHFFHNLDFSFSFWTLASKVLDFHWVFDIVIAKVCNCRHFFFEFLSRLHGKHALTARWRAAPAPPVDTLWWLFWPLEEPSSETLLGKKSRKLSPWSRNQEHQLPWAGWLVGSGLAGGQKSRKSRNQRKHNEKSRKLAPWSRNPKHLPPWAGWLAGSGLAGVGKSRKSINQRKHN